MPQARLAEKTGNGSQREQGEPDDFQWVIDGGDEHLICGHGYIITVSRCDDISLPGFDPSFFGRCCVRS